MGQVKLEHMDILDWAASYDGEPFHAILCDCPYEYSFMSKKWDGTGVSFQPETWEALAKHLHPGAFGMTFAGARTYHRIAIAIEDAGLRLHPAIFGWSFATGFPKATRIDTQIDKAAGAEREVVGKSNRHSGRIDNSPYHRPGITERVPDITAPATELAAAWQGHRYGLQAMKPALEPIIVFQKPYEGKPVECIVATGAGSLWIDGARIGTEDKLQKLHGSFSFSGSGGANETGKRIEHVEPGQGRWPANFTLTHHPDCKRVGVEQVKAGVWDAQPVNSTPGSDGKTMGKGWRNEAGTRPEFVDVDGLETISKWECVPECAVRKLGEQSGVRPGPWGANSKGKAGGSGSMFSLGGVNSQNELRGQETGTAARFFFQADWELDNTDPVFYCAKAARRERDQGMPEGQRNTHPTVKPISLAKHLATLLLPPEMYTPRRLLVPFSGSGSEIIGAGLVGWDSITGIDSDTEACAITEARIAHWLKQPQQLELA